MPPKRSGVRGPNSALTEFLRVEGITDAFRQRRDRDQATPEAAPEPVATARQTRSSEVPEEAEEEEEEEDEEVVIRAAAAKKKRNARKRGDLPSDDDLDDANYSEDDDLNTNNKKFGEQDDCAECGDPFTLSVYSRFIKDKAGYICESCNEKHKQRERAAKRNQLNARRKRKKVALALLNKSKVLIPKLQDICIKTITLNIDDVDVLGDIGQMNLMKISRILSKNRSLNDSTVTLFLNPSLKNLEFWDCSNVDSDSLSKIAAFCPNLESLTLFMCGQLHNDTLKYYSTNLKNLTELCLNGPFLISDVMWQEFFDSIRLTKFEVRNTHRFGNDSLISLLETSGNQLSSLKLSRLDGLDSADVYGLLPHYLTPSLVSHLELSYPGNPEVVTDDLLINILATTGESLEFLNVDGCTSLTDRFLTEGVSKFCPVLTHLSMRGLHRVTDEGFAKAFLEYPQVNSGGLLNVDLTKCVGLGDNAIYALFVHSAPTLVELNLNSLDLLSKDFLLQIFTDDHHPSKVSIKNKTEAEGDLSELQFYHQVRFPLLTTWDVGFVRAIDNEILAKIGESCPKLTIIEVYGNNRCSFAARVKKDLMIIGRQSDEI